MSNDKLGVVTGFFDSGAPVIQFDGEQEPSKKEYPYIATYIPHQDDRVLCMSVGDSYVIMGAINFEIAPKNEDNITNKTITTGVLTVNTAKIDKLESKQLDDTQKTTQDNAKKIEEANKKITENYNNLNNSINGTDRNVNKLSSSLNNSVRNLENKISANANKISKVDSSAILANNRANENRQSILSLRNDISSNAGKIMNNQTDITQIKRDITYLKSKIK